MGDIMLLVYIQNYSFLTKVIQYLKQADIQYTTDFDMNFSSILLAEMNSKSLKIMDEYPDKRIIFMTHLEEGKIVHCFQSNQKRSRLYRNRYHSFFSKCYKLIVSLPYFKTLFKKDCDQIDVIPYEIPIINISRNTRDIYQKYHLNKRKKRIIVIDLYYDYVEFMYDVAVRYPKFEFIYMGYQPKYLLTRKQSMVLQKLPPSIVYIPYFNENIFSDICKIGCIVIDFTSYLLNRSYLYISLSFKSQLLLLDTPLYQDFLIPSKHCYFFKTKDELLLRLGKIIDDRAMNLTDVGYDLIRNYTFYEIVQKYRDSLQ